MRPVQVAPVGTLALAATLTLGALLVGPEAHAATGPAPQAPTHRTVHAR